VSALLLKEQGYDVQGLFMKNWEEDDTPGFCSAESDLNDVKAVCRQLKIPVHTVNFAHEYWERVFSLFLDEVRAGRTPNPDVLCNQEIKFKAFLEHALTLGADFIATGHYAQKSNQAPYTLIKGADQNKDQTYFIYPMRQDALAKTLFPVGHLAKPAVRQMAQNANLPIYDKKDSTGICFIGERKFKDFLKDFVLAQPGPIHTPDGQKVGQHDGLMFYTLGQRQGLGIGGRKGALEKPWYVIAKDLAQNTLIVTQDHDHPWHFSSNLVATDVHWIQGFPPATTFSAKAKVRYRQLEKPCAVTVQIDGTLEVAFTEPQRAVTPGQSVVFYDGEGCLGGAIIDKTNSLGGIRAVKFNRSIHDAIQT
jgi:tRNA-specific 2-thiouridylase